MFMYQTNIKKVGSPEAKALVTNHMKSIEKLVDVICFVYAPTWLLIVKNSDLTDGPINMLALIKSTKKIPNEETRNLVQHQWDINHYFLVADSVAVILGHKDIEIRKKAVEKLQLLHQDLPHDFIGGECRIFRQQKLIDHDDIYDFLTINSFNSPIFQDMTLSEINVFLNDIWTGEDLLAYYRSFDCHTRLAERNVQLMSKTWKECKLVNVAEGKQRVSKTHYERFEGDDYFRKGAFEESFRSMTVSQDSDY